MIVEGGASRTDKEGKKTHYTMKIAGVDGEAFDKINY